MIEIVLQHRGLVQDDECKHTETHFNTPHHTAPHCTTLQRAVLQDAETLITDALHRVYLPLGIVLQHRELIDEHQRRVYLLTVIILV